MWQVLFHVNPITIATALGVCLLAALAFAWWRRPNTQRFQGAMRKLLTAAGAVYLAVLLAPIGDPGFSQGGGRTVIWNPALSFQDIRGVGEHAGQEKTFGQTLEDSRTVHYSADGATAQERSYYDFFVQDGPEGTLLVTDAEGQAPSREDAALAAATTAEHLEFQADYTARIEAEGPWGTTGGLVLQERVLNTLLFVPIGVVAFFAFSAWTARLLCGPALSLTVEASQWALPWGRLADIGDLMVNSAGSLVGTLLAAVSVALVSTLRPVPAAGNGEDDRLSPAPR